MPISASIIDYYTPKPDVTIQGPAEGIAIYEGDVLKIWKAECRK